MVVWLANPKLNFLQIMEFRVHFFQNCFQLPSIVFVCTIFSSPSLALCKPSYRHVCAPWRNVDNPSHSMRNRHSIRRCISWCLFSTCLSMRGMRVASSLLSPGRGWCVLWPSPPFLRSTLWNLLLGPLYDICTDGRTNFRRFPPLLETSSLCLRFSSVNLCLITIMVYCPLCLMICFLKTMLFIDIPLDNPMSFTYLFWEHVLHRTRSFLKALNFGILCITIWKLPLN